MAIDPRKQKELSPSAIIQQLLYPTANSTNAPMLPSAPQQQVPQLNNALNSAPQNAQLQQQQQNTPAADPNNPFAGGGRMDLLQEGGKVISPGYRASLDNAQRNQRGIGLTPQDEWAAMFPSTGSQVLPGRDNITSVSPEQQRYNNIRTGNVRTPENNAPSQAILDMAAMGRAFDPAAGGGMQGPNGQQLTAEDFANQMRQTYTNGQQADQARQTAGGQQVPLQQVLGVQAAPTPGVISGPYGTGSVVPPQAPQQVQASSPQQVAAPVMQVPSQAQTSAQPTVANAQPQFPEFNPSTRYDGNPGETTPTVNPNTLAPVPVQSSPTAQPFVPMDAENVLGNINPQRSKASVARQRLVTPIEDYFSSLQRLFTGTRF